MLRRLCLAALLLAVVCPDAASAGLPNVAFDGGTPAERSTVRAAFAASRFPWELVTARVVIHIERGVPSHAMRGEIWLDGNLLDAGRFSWGVVQHEFAHQVDFFLLDDAKRAVLAARLGGVQWWDTGRATLAASNGFPAHASLTAERFASSLTWAFWPCRDNVLRPEQPGDEAGALAPREFRALLASLLGLG
jgi:hypothetical protein